MKWLKKVPQSGEQVLAVINEANDEYNKYKLLKKAANKAGEKQILDKGIFVGSRVKVLGAEKFAGRIATVKNISGRSVTVIFDDQPEMRWRLKGYDYEVIK